MLRDKARREPASSSRASSSVRGSIVGAPSAAPSPRHGDEWNEQQAALRTGAAGLPHGGCETRRHIKARAWNGFTLGRLAREAVSRLREAATARRNVTGSIVSQLHGSRALLLTVKCRQRGKFRRVTQRSVRPQVAPTYTYQTSSFYCTRLSPPSSTQGIDRMLCRDQPQRPT